MFTGLIQHLGGVREISAARLVLDPLQEDVTLGESIAINGVCLTVVAHDPYLKFDLSEETFRRTSLGNLRPGNRVNVERAMRMGDRLGGHLVQGHVDATGHVVNIENHPNSTTIRFAAAAEFGRYLADKGSICVDGISLTIVSPEAGQFDTWIIPHTLANTNLAQLKIGDSVNLEFDAIAKYVERLMHPYLSPKAA